MTDPTIERPPELLRQDDGPQQGHLVRAELLLETHRVTGAFEQSGPPKRLVDTLNAIDGPTAVLRDAIVESLANHGEDQLRFDLLQLKRDAILVAIPATDIPHSPGAEIIEKKPVLATFMLPGLEVTGHAYLPQAADPAAMPMLGRESFLPVKDAHLTQVAHGGGRRQEPLVVVNLGRVLLYAPDLS